MSKEKNDLFDDALDKFWTIDEITPKQKNNYLKIKLESETAEINLSAEKGNNINKDESKTYFIPPYAPKKPRKPEYEYDVQNSLIHHVTVYNVSTTPDYEHERFHGDALKFCDVRGKPCELVEFYSRSPQYTQLTKKQLNFYLYWRDCARKGEYIETEFCYILLYVYELISLGTLLNVKKSALTIFNLWENYKDVYQIVDKACTELLCDFVLLNKIDIMEIIDPTKLAQLMPNAFLKELYFCTDLDKCKESVQYLLDNCTNYNYKKSKFATEENLPIYEEHISNALKYTLKKLSVTGFLSETGHEDSTISRLSYVGLHCSPSPRKKIVVSLTSFSSFHELRFMISDIIKYSENKIRAALGIKARLSYFSLSEETKKIVDQYFSERLPEKINKPAKIEVEKFDPNYDVVSGEISIYDALNIEKSSWETVDTLIGAFEDEEKEVILPISKKVVNNEVQTNKDEKIDEVLKNPYEDYSEFLDYIIDGDYISQQKYAQKSGKLLDTLADGINEIALEQIGDVLLYSAGGGYLIIEDYMEDFINVFRS